MFKTIAGVAEKSNTRVYIVGGFVRDILLNRQSKDVDFVVVGSGISFAQKVAIEFGKGTSARYFKNFGTAMVKYG